MPADNSQRCHPAEQIAKTGRTKKKVGTKKTATSSSTQSINGGDAIVGILAERGQARFPKPGPSIETGKTHCGQPIPTLPNAKTTQTAAQGFKNQPANADKSKLPERIRGHL